MPAATPPIACTPLRRRPAWARTSSSAAMVAVLSTMPIAAGSVILASRSISRRAKITRTMTGMSTAVSARARIEVIHQAVMIQASISGHLRNAGRLARHACQQLVGCRQVSGGGPKPGLDGAQTSIDPVDLLGQRRRLGLNLL